MSTYSPECTCPRDENESLSTVSPACPEHGHLAPAPSEIAQRWCPGSSETVDVTSKRTGRCRACHQIVPQKYAVAGVHLPDGTTPRA